MGLSDMFRASLSQGYKQLIEMEKHIDHYTHQIETHSRHNAHIRGLQTLPGYGPIIERVLASAIGDGKAFKRGRDVSASLGLVPANTPVGAKKYCWGSASKATNTCAAY